MFISGTTLFFIFLLIACSGGGGGSGEVSYNHPSIEELEAQEAKEERFKRIYDRVIFGIGLILWVPILLILILQILPRFP